MEIGYKSFQSCNMEMMKNKLPCMSPEDIRILMMDLNSLSFMFLTKKNCVHASCYLDIPDWFT